MDFLTLTIGKQKNIALIAHDSKKHEMIDWCEANKEILKGHFLCGTGTTARMITEATGLPVKGYNSGPLGGDQQIGAKIVEGRIDFVVFFSDPLTAQPHDPDVKALLRIAQVYDIPIANNRATADFLISSPLMNETYDHRVINFHEAIADRAKKLYISRLLQPSGLHEYKKSRKTFITSVLLLFLSFHISTYFTVVDRFFQLL